MKVKNNMIWIWILALICLEQGIKVIINNNFLEKRYSIIPPFIYFEPMFNRNYSWIDSMFQLGVSRWVHISIVLIMSLLIILFYIYLKRSLGTNKFVNVMFAFVFSGAVCSLFDKVFWNGSLDYILINGYFTFDLKDVYIDVFIGLMLLSLLIKNQYLEQMEEKRIIKGFLRWISGKRLNA